MEISKESQLVWFPGRYEPITVQKGVPVIWTITAESSDINGCNNALIIPEFSKEP